MLWKLEYAGKDMQKNHLMKLIFVLITTITSDLVAQQNNLSYSVAWKQTAAEHRALYHQGFNIARLRIESALTGNEGGKPLAIISDIDETLLLANDY